MASLGGATAVLLSCAVYGRDSAQVPRIGFFLTHSRPESFIAAFQKGLREHGYHEGKNIILEYSSSGGRSGRVRAASELVRRDVDIIVVNPGTGAIRAVMKATKTVPIVMTGGSDPVANGIVASLARPGGNVTGLTSFTHALSGKRLEVLRETVPTATRVAVIYDETNPVKAAEFQETQRSALRLGVQLLPLPLRIAEDLEGAFNKATEGGAQALIMLQSPLTIRNRKRIAQFARENRLPNMFPERGLLDSGALMSYGPNYADLSRRAASYVDRILKGAKPAELPVEQPSAFDLAISMKTAKALGITIPPSILLRATEVIE